MEKEQFKHYIGQLIQHRHSDRKALLLEVEDGENGGLKIQWAIDPYKISLPACDFEIMKEVNHVTI